MGRKKRNRSGDNRGISKAAQRQAMDLTTQLLESMCLYDYLVKMALTGFLFYFKFMYFYVLHIM